MEAARPVSESPGKEECPRSNERKRKETTSEHCAQKVIRRQSNTVCSEDNSSESEVQADKTEEKEEEPLEKVIQLNLECEISSRSIIVRWNQVFDDNIGKYHLSFSKTTPPNGYKNGNRQWKFTAKGHETENTVKTSPGCTYLITVEFRSHSDKSVLAIGEITATARFNRDEMLQLMQKATDFAGTEMDNIKFMYRVKSQQYWDKVRSDDKGVISKAVKDFAGQPANQINGRLEGIFFASKTINGCLPTRSPFGTVRLRVPVENLLSAASRLYFADFYCMNTAHYVTIVACMSETEAHNFCEENLIEIDAEKNPFMQINTSDDELIVSLNKRLWVEIFYTESLSIQGLEEMFETVKSTEIPRLDSNGVPNRKDCATCNVYPRIAYEERRFLRIPSHSYLDDADWEWDDHDYPEIDDTPEMSI